MPLENILWKFFDIYRLFSLKDKCWNTYQHKLSSTILVFSMMGNMLGHGDFNKVCVVYEWWDPRE